MSAEVRQRILDVAERHFGRHGVAATTIRAMTAEAGVNVASIHYHFRSKEELYRAVVERRLGPLNEERLHRLKGCPRDVREILRVLVEPAFRLGVEHPEFARLLSRLRFEEDESLWPAYRQHQAELVAAFRKALEAVLPAMTAAELDRRLHFVLGGIHQVWARGRDDDPQELLESFLAFYTAGLTGRP